MAPRVAVVNKDPAVLTAIQEALVAAGYDVERLLLGIGIYEVLRRLRPAAILLDLPSTEGDVVLNLPTSETSTESTTEAALLPDLPATDTEVAMSWTLIQMVLHDPALQGTPVVVTVDDHPDLIARVRALRGEALEVVPKPFAVQALVQVVQRLVG